MKPGDFMVFQKKERLPVTDLAPRAALELYILIDDASDMSLGSQLGDLKQFIENQPAETSIGIGYMRNGTVEFTEALTADHAKAAKGLRFRWGIPA